MSKITQRSHRLLITSSKSIYEKVLSALDHFEIRAFVQELKPEAVVTVPAAESEVTSASLRQQALALLEQAHALDGRKPFVLVHRHEYGDTTYLTWQTQEPSGETLQKVLQAPFEPEKDEEVLVADVDMAEVVGLPKTV